MGITVTNNSSNKIEVAINKWGNDGDTSFFSIGKEKKETWDRSDSRGFVLSLKRSGTQKPYYVQADSLIAVGNTDVKDGDRIIDPISS